MSFAWLTNWFSDPTRVGPARNLPNGSGAGISDFFKQNPQCIVILSQEELTISIKKLHRVQDETIEDKPAVPKITRPTDELNAIGDVSSFFERKKAQREMKTHVAGEVPEQKKDLSEFFRKKREERAQQERMAEIMNNPKLRRQHREEVEEYLAKSGVKMVEKAVRRQQVDDIFDDAVVIAM